MTDIMSREKRSVLMSRIKGKNTGLERAVFAGLRQKGLVFSRHAQDLPGRPDIVVRRSKVVVFIDGDFWHGWQVPRWRNRLDPWWRKKIQATRARDARTMARLRRRGWVVLRVWEHQVERQLSRVIQRILMVTRSRPSRSDG